MAGSSYGLQSQLSYDNGEAPFLLFTGPVWRQVTLFPSPNDIFIAPPSRVVTLQPEHGELLLFIPYQTFNLSSLLDPE